MNARARVFLAALFVLFASGGVFAYRSVVGPSVDWSGVASIRSEPAFQDPALLERALALPTAAEYPKPIEPQKNGSFCGPASLVNVLRSMDRPASQDTIFEKSTMFTIFGHLPGGMTLDALADLSRNKLRDHETTILRDLDLESFRREIEKSNDPRRRVIVNFHRGPLFGGGGGHHSPIGGYLAEEDLVLILDVNPEYGPFLVKTARLFEAVETVDPATDRKRGLLILRPKEAVGRAMLRRLPVPRDHRLEPGHAAFHRLRRGAEG